MAERSKDAETGVIWQDPEVRQALDGMVEPLAALDRNGRIAFVNRALAESNPERSLVGEDAWAAWPELEDPQTHEAFDRAFATGLPARLLRPRPDSDRKVEFSAHRSGDHLLVSARDAVDPKSVGGREGPLQAMVDALPHIAWHTDPDGRVVVNDRWRAYSGSEGTGVETFRAHVHPDDLSLTERALEGRSLGKAYEYDLRVRDARGVYRWHRVRVAPYRSAPNEPLSWIGTTTDVHDERTRERTLRLLLDVTERTRIVHEPSEVLTIALRALTEALDLSWATYAEISEDGESFVRLQQWPLSVEAPSGRLASLGDSLLQDGRVGRTTAIDDVRTAYGERVAGRYEARGSRAFVSVPLVKQGRFVAALAVHVGAPRAWTEDEIEAVRLVADRCWTEIERARAQRAAGEREGRLRALVEANPVGIAVVDVETGVALEANEACLRLIGRTRGELEARGIDFYAISSDDGRALSQSRIDEARRTGSTGFYEKTYARPDGTRVPVLVGFTPLDAEVRRVTAFMLDLTDLRRAEQAVAEGERRWRLLAETIPAIVFSLRPDGSVEYVNSRGEAYFGEGKAAEALGTLAQSIARGEPFEVERPFVRADRAYRWHLCRTEPMRDEAGGVVRWIGTLTDVHEAKSRERVLRFLVDLDDATANLEEPAHAIREMAFMLVGAVGADRCVYAEVVGDGFTILGDYARIGPSRAGYHALDAYGDGYAARLRAGKTFVADDLDGLEIPPEVRAAYAAAGIAAVVCAPIVRGGRLVATMAAHQSRPRRWTPEEVDLVEQVAGRSWANIERVRGRRELRGSEERLREANEGLERKVSERTKELQDANDALQGFGYHISHDLRTPLRAIVSTSRMIQMDYGDGLPAEARTLLSRQAEAARKLGELIDDLLQLSRLSQAELEKSTVDLTTLARDAAEEALSEHPQTRVRIEVTDGLIVQADPRLLRLALVNLFENAVKYSPGGGTVRMFRRPNGDFAISDEGIGMEPQYLERIFEPFQRLHRDEAFKGTGIGLANVRRVLTRHGGAVWAESELGEGSTFVMRL